MKNVKKTVICLVLAVMMVSVAAFALCACDEQEETVVETVFRIDPDESVIWPDFYTMIKKAVDFDTSAIILRSNGTMTLRLMIDDQINSLLKLVLGGNQLPDLSGAIETYVKPIAPGFDQKDFLGSVERCGKALGISLVGFDPENPTIAALVDSLENGTTLPKDISLPSDLGIEVNYNYCIKKVTNAAGHTYDAVYLTPSDSDTQPYVVMTLGTDEETGRHSLNLMIDFIKLNLTAYEELPADAEANA